MIGLSRIGIIHCHSLVKLKKTQLSFVYDCDDKWSNKFAYKFNCKTSSRFEDILNQLDFQINKLEKKELQIAVHGRVGVGKSSLLNALIEKQIFPTDIINGNTKTSKSYKLDKRFQGLNKVELIDSPGIDEINNSNKEEINFNTVLDADLILNVIGFPTRCSKSSLSHITLESRWLPVMGFE